MEKPYLKLKHLLIIVFTLSFHFNSSALLFSKSQHWFHKKNLFTLNTNTFLDLGESEWTSFKKLSKISFLWTLKDEVSLNRPSTMRVDIEKNLGKNLKSQLDSWLVDYKQFGFDVIESKPFMLDTNKAILIKLTQPDKKLSIRQVIIQNKKELITFTCTSEDQNSLKAFKECNRSIKNLVLL